jgi:hypothetical protein
MVSFAAECQTLARRRMLGLRMCVDGEVPLGSRGTPSSKIARLVLSCAPASEMRAPCSWMSIAEADRLTRMAAMASQVVAS